MQIGIIGAGNIGHTVAELLVDAGHEAAVSNSRGPESLSGLVEELGPGARAVTPAGAAEWGEVVVLAVPFRHREQLPAAERFADAVVIDAMNRSASSASRRRCPCSPWSSMRPSANKTCFGVRRGRTSRWNRL